MARVCVVFELDVDLEADYGPLHQTVTNIADSLRTALPTEVTEIRGYMAVAEAAETIMAVFGQTS